MLPFLGASTSINRVLDIGISSGVTTFDLMNTLQENGYAPQIHAVDRVITIRKKEFAFGSLFFEARTGHLLQIEMGGIGVRNHLRRRDFLTGAFLWRAPLLAWARRLKPDPNTSTANFVAPELTGNSKVSVREFDILNPWPAEVQEMDVIRIANLMQSVYFSEAQLKLLAEKISAACRGAGSIVVVCREYKGKLDASFFRMSSDRSLEVIHRVGGGSPSQHYFTS